MLLSIIIPTYCCYNIFPDRLILSIQGFLNQTLNNYDYEIIVVDDGSEYDIQKLIKEEFAKNTMIRVLNKRHEGMCSAINYGVNHSEAEYVFIGVDDNIPFPDSIEKLLKNSVLGDKKNVGVIGQEYWLKHTNFIKNILTSELYDDVNVKEFYTEYIDVMNEFPKISKNDVTEKYEKLLEYSTLLPGYKQFGRVFTSNGFDSQWLCIRPGIFIIKREIYNNLGGFDKKFDPTGWYSDIEFGYSLYKNGYCINFEASSKFIHMPHEKFFMNNNYDEKKCFNYLLQKYSDPYIAMLPFIWLKDRYCEYMDTCRDVLKNMELIGRLKK